MPLYEYQCESCGRRFEEMQRVDDPPVASCPECGGKVRKLLSAPAFQFKGSGWYVTDYARAGGGAKKSTADAGASSESAPAEKSDAKESAAKSGGESKPAAPAPTSSPKD